jgi:hypothetical protein
MFGLTTPDNTSCRWILQLFPVLPSILIKKPQVPMSRFDRRASFRDTLSPNLSLPVPRGAQPLNVLCVLLRDHCVRIRPPPTKDTHILDRFIRPLHFKLWPSLVPVNSSRYTRPSISNSTVRRRHRPTLFQGVPRRGRMRMVLPHPAQVLGG